MPAGPVVEFRSVLVEEPDGGTHIVDTLSIPPNPLIAAISITEEAAGRIVDAYEAEVSRALRRLLRVAKIEDGIAIIARGRKRPLLAFGSRESYTFDGECRVRVPILGGFLVAPEHTRHGFLEFGIARDGPVSGDLPRDTLSHGLRLMSRVVGYYPRIGGNPLARFVYRHTQYRFHARMQSRVLRRAWSTLAAPPSPSADTDARLGESRARN